MRPLTAPPRGVRAVHERRGEDHRLAVVVERNPEQREVARRHVEGIAEDVVDAARVRRLPRAEAVERNVCSRAICRLSHAIGKVSKDEHAIC